MGKPILLFRVYCDYLPYIYITLVAYAIYCQYLSPNPPKECLGDSP